MAAVVHTTNGTGTESGDGNVSKTAWEEGHTIDWAEADDLRAPLPAAAAGSGTTEVPRSDHIHQDSAAGRCWASQNFV